jgi:hypothetical protein
VLRISLAAVSKSARILIEAWFALTELETSADFSGMSDMMSEPTSEAGSVEVSSGRLAPRIK